MLTRRVLISIFVMVATVMAAIDCQAKTGKEIIAENGLKSQVLPLIQTHWSQYFGEQDLCPVVDNNNTHARPGCGPVATGQILRYWASHLSPSGLNYYLWTKPDNTEHILINVPLKSGRVL